MCMTVTVFYSMIPCSLVEKQRLFGGIYYLIFHPKYGAIFFSETSTDFFRTTRRHIEDKSSIQYLRYFVDNSRWCRCQSIIVCFDSGSFTAVLAYLSGYRNILTSEREVSAKTGD